MTWSAVCSVLLCLVYSGSPAATAEDTSQIVKIDITGGFYHQIGLVAGNKREQFSAPEYLAVRRADEPELAETWNLNNDRVTDSPMGHGASYIRLHSWYSPTPEVELYGSLAVNHAGFSFGPYNTFAVALLPRYHVAYNQQFDVAGDSLWLRGTLGTFENIQCGEGLMVYNLDVQGLQWETQWGNFFVGLRQIADLQMSVGLAIDGVAEYEAGFRRLHTGKGWQTDITAALRNLTDTRYPNSVDVVAVTGALYRDSLRLYAEAGYRLSDDDLDPVLNYAVLLGARGAWSGGGFNIQYRAEYRHYGGGFNYALRDEASTHYRDTERPPGGNYIGNQVYPLEYLNRPFSTWAVFTEYHKRWVSGVSLAAQAVYPLGRALELLADADFNLIAAEGEQPFLYPFFKVGARVQAIDNTYIAATLTNKTMNLDKHYTTYYLLRYPVLQLELRRDIAL